MRSPWGSNASLYQRSLLAVFAVVATVVLVGGFLQVRALEEQATRHLTASLTSLARTMEPQLHGALKSGGADAQALATSLAQRSGCRVSVIDGEGKVRADSELTAPDLAHLENHRDRPEVRAALGGGVGSVLRYSTTLQHPMLYVAVPLGDPSRGGGALRVAVPATVVSELRSETRRTVVASLAVGLLLAAAVGAWLARGITRPLARLVEVARAYARGDFSAGAPHLPTRELNQLADTMGAMGRRIQTHIGHLSAERNQATAILESMAEGVIALDTSGGILVANPAAERLLGAPTGSLSGASLFEGVRNAELHRLVREAMGGRPGGVEDMTVFQPRERTLRTRAVPCPGDAGPALVLVLQDVTEHYRYDRLRRDFVANVSHELKTPLTSIRSLSETLLEGALDDPSTHRRFVHLIEEDAIRLTRLIDDLLALSQIESRAVPLKLSALDLEPFVSSITAAFEMPLEDAALQLTVDIPAGLAVLADPDRLRQVLDNLIDNAVKYNRPNGSITVSAAPKGAFVEISVRDTGVGIPAEDLSRVFERFYRVDKTRSRELGGTGLGLSIVKHIVEAHGGTVWVDSTPGAGSSFTFTVATPRRPSDTTTS